MGSSGEMRLDSIWIFKKSIKTLANRAVSLLAPSHRRALPAAWDRVQLSLGTSRLDLLDRNEGRAGAGLPMLTQAWAGRWALCDVVRTPGAESSAASPGGRCGLGELKEKQTAGQEAKEG